MRAITLYFSVKSAIRILKLYLTKFTHGHFMLLYKSKKNIALKLVTATIACSALFVGQASAQTAGDATTIANPSRVEQGFKQGEDLPDVKAKIEVKDLVLQEVPKGAEDISFNLISIQLDGLTIYDPSDLTPVYASKLGTTITLADIYGIATALTTKFRNDGYILTQVIVPPQTIETGIVRLQVIEGFIDKITVEGDESERSLKKVRNYANLARTGKALNVKDLERVLLLINDLAGVEARSVLSPSKTTTGASDLQIIVNRDNYEGMISMDNFGSRFLGPVQFSTSATSHNLISNNESISLQGVYAPGRSNVELAYAALTYKQPIFDHGTNIQFFWSETHTEPGFGLEIFKIHGQSKFYSARIEHPFIRSRTENLYGYATFDWRDLNSKSLFGTLKDRIRTARFGATYEFLDTFMSVGINSINLELSKGLNIFGASDEGDANMTRTLGNPQFFKANLNAQRLQRIMNKVNLLIEAHGQWSAHPLLSSEEFGVGGINLGRGYDSSEIIGDDGVAGKLELQWRNPTEPGWQYLEEYHLFSFYDTGVVWEQDATTSKLSRDTITSAGFGVRAKFTGSEADLTVAFPLNRSVQTQGNESPRVFANWLKRF